VQAAHRTRSGAGLGVGSGLRSAPSVVTGKHGEASRADATAWSWRGAPRRQCGAVLVETIFFLSFCFVIGVTQPVLELVAMIQTIPAGSRTSRNGPLHHRRIKSNIPKPSVMTIFGPAVIGDAGVYIAWSTDCPKNVNWSQ